MKITISGKKYLITEKLPYHGCGCLSVVVETKTGERIAVKQGGVWRFWTVQDRLGIKNLL